MRIGRNLVLLFLITSVLAVDESKFKTCSQDGFCARHRSKPTKLQYTVDPSSVKVNDQSLHAVLVPSRPQTTGLELVATVLPNDLFRVHVAEVSPLNGKKRFEADDVLMPEYTKEQKLRLVEQDEEKATIESENKHVRLTIEYSPFHISYYVYDKLKVTINDKNLFYFEVTRTKDEAISSQQTPEVVVDNSEPKKERKIVDYTEAGHAIYEDGSIENPDEKMEAEVPVDGSASTASTTEATEATETTEKEDETGYWSEYFSGKTDSKPNGPQSVGADITFHGARALYGIPQHSSAFKLETTVDGHFKDPYRLFNLDVFEYATDRNTALYGSVPFLVAHSEDASLGLLWLNPTGTFVDVYAPADGKQTTQWMSEAGVIDLFLFPAATPAELLDQYTRLTSRPMMPPFFALGYHQSRWNYLDEKDCRDVNDKFEALNFPYDVLWLDIEHTIGKKYFTWDPNNFPHPEQLVDYLAAHGHRLVTIIDPHVKKEAGYRINEELKKLGYLLKTASGEVFEGWCWPGASNYPDFTNPAVRQWWSDQFSNGLYAGNSDYLYTWNDMNEPSVFDGPEVTMPRDVVSMDGYEHRAWHNMHFLSPRLTSSYGYYYHKACAEGQMQRSPNQRPLVLTRSVFVGSQRNGPMWTGDVFSNWDHLAATLPQMLALGVAGIVFSGSDVPGYFKDPSEELAVRWYQFGAWMPFFRAHAHIDTKRREPWTFTEPTYQRIRDAVVERYTFLPVMYTAFWQAYTTGAPVMRPLMFADPFDAEGFAEDRAFMLGDAMLVAPVVAEGARTVTTYVPQGEWVSIYDYSVVEGGKVMELPAPLEHIAVYYRRGSIVARLMRLRRSALQMKHDPFTLMVMADKDGKAEGWVFDDDRDGYGYTKGVYAYMHLWLKDGVLRCEKEGQFVSANLVERVVVLAEKAPTKVSVTVDGATRPLEFSYDAEKKLVTIRKPEVRMTGNWEIRME